MGANFSTNHIDTREKLEDIIITYIMQSSDKDVELIDDKVYRTNTINIMCDILTKYLDNSIIDEIFYHIGGDDNMLEIDLYEFNYTHNDSSIDMRFKCKFLSDFYYEIYVLYNKIKNLILAVNHLLEQLQQEYNKYQQVGDVYDDMIESEIESLEYRLNKLQLVRINFYHLLGGLFVKHNNYFLNKNISLDKIIDIRNIIDYEINTFSDKIKNLNQCE
jgi:hypothetical protein